MNLAQHADASSDIRRAAGAAAEISTALNKLNSGPVFDHERERLIQEVGMNLKGLAAVLGYKSEAA